MESQSSEHDFVVPPKRKYWVHPVPSARNSHLLQHEGTVAGTVASQQEGPWL